MAKAASQIEMPIGVVVRKTPGVTRWARWNWRAVAVLPGAGPADWQELRREGDAVEYHAATLPLTLWPDETEAYMVNLADGEPSIYLVLRDELKGDQPLNAVLVTASPFEGQDYADTGEEIVEKIPMTEGLVAWVRDFTLQHHKDEVFVKRRRDKKRIDLVEDGRGDARIRQESDVYRAPRRILN
ncbi:molybdopterin-guanine dinucleotide biosynthesis protein A [Rhodobacteraceae bacterium KLH11]|nr:molybdopterin-guanine dinucleotide biosynthesis protein A [Rhodobacteraceae bacterium KLH11]